MILISAWLNATTTQLIHPLGMLYHIWQIKQYALLDTSMMRQHLGEESADARTCQSIKPAYHVDVTHGQHYHVPSGMATVSTVRTLTVESSNPTTAPSI